MASLTSRETVDPDRAAGLMVGVAVGDALGAGYEFTKRRTPDEVVMVKGTLTGRVPGSWTDDTEMTICVAEASARGLDLDSSEGLDEVGAWFLRWFKDGPDDIGMQTYGVLSSVKEPSMLAEGARRYQTTRPTAAGNGSLMRTAPVALAHLGDDEAIARSARTVSSLTHPHDLAGDACVIWSIAIDRALREDRIDGIYDGIALLPEERRGYWEKVLADAESVDLEEIYDNGFVVTALQAAWRAVWSTKEQRGPAHIDLGLRTAVAIGGDTDTVAAIAGGLLGARYGASAIPFHWRRRLSGWPPGYGYRDLVSLGVLAARTGRSDEAGWPAADDLSTYYRAHNQTASSIGTLPNHPGVSFGSIDALATSQAKSFVSLCRIGRAQRRGVEHDEIWLTDDEHNAHLEFVLGDAADAIEALRVDHGSVFVHCVNGVSRTPAVVAAWLIRHRGLDRKGALEALYPTDNAVSLRPSFVAALGAL